jgi:hypothetical protein
LRLSDIGGSADSEVVPLYHAGGRSARRDHSPSVEAVAPTLSDLYPRPIGVHHVPPHGMSLPVPRPSPSIVTPVTNISATESSSPAIGGSPTPFPTSDTSLFEGSTFFLPQSGSFVPPGTEYFSATPLDDFDSHERHRTYSSGTVSSLEPSLTSSESFLDAASQYSHALHQSETLESPYPQDGYGGGWLESGPLAENSEPFVPGVTSSNDLLDMNTLCHNEAAQFDPIDIGASNGTRKSPLTLNRGRMFVTFLCTVPWIVISSGDHQPSHEAQQDNFYVVVVFAPPSIDLQAASAFDMDLNGANVNNPVESINVGDIDSADDVSAFALSKRILLRRAACHRQLTSCEDALSSAAPITVNPLHVDFSCGIASNNVINFASELRDTPRPPSFPHSEYSPPLWPDTLDPRGASAPDGLSSTSEPSSNTSHEGNVLVTFDAAPRDQSPFFHVFEDFCEY